MKLSERAMIACLHAGSWTGQLVDQDVTDEVSQSHQAEQDAGKYRKQIVARKFLHHVNSRIGMARRTHRVLTLPWDDNGERILSAMGYVQYTTQMRLQREAVEAAANEFATNMDEYIVEAKVRLGTMFDQADYPEADDIRKKFYVDVEIKPVPEAGDFRTELSEKTVKAIVADIERRSNERLEAAINDVFQRIATLTSHMVERLRVFTPAQGSERAQNIFKDSLVYNIKELADLLPSLNITNDGRIEKLRLQLLDDLTEHSPDLLRADERLRQRTADKAEKIYEKVKQYLG